MIRSSVSRLRPKTGKIYRSDATAQMPVPPEVMGIPHVVLFRIPIEGGKDWLLTLPLNYADIVDARAQAGDMTSEEYLVDLIKRALHA